METDAVYFRRRANEERERAGRAANDSAREIHLEMAKRYDELASAIAPRDPQQAPGTVSALAQTIAN